MLAHPSHPSFPSASPSNYSDEVSGNPLVLLPLRLLPRTPLQHPRFPSPLRVQLLSSPLPSPPIPHPALLLPNLSLAFTNMLSQGTPFKSGLDSNTFFSAQAPSTPTSAVCILPSPTTAMTGWDLKATSSLLLVPRISTTNPRRSCSIQAGPASLGAGKIGR